MKENQPIESWQDWREDKKKELVRVTGRKESDVENWLQRMEEHAESNDDLWAFFGKDDIVYIIEDILGRYEKI